VRIGIQDQGFSTEPIYKLAERTIRDWDLPRNSMILDLGGGDAGHFAKTLSNYFCLRSSHGLRANNSR
jgi:hypothetical protein